jgi:hypothetical protein
MTIHNNTTLSTEGIAQLILIGKTISTWRKRRVTLYEHPTDPDRVISIGVTYGRSARTAMQVIADEPRSQWAAALAAIAHGKTHFSA